MPHAGLAPRRGEEVARRPARRGRVGGGRLPRFVRELSRVVRDVGPDVLYTNSAKAHIVGIPLARALGVPAVMHVHNGIAAHTYGRPNRAALHARRHGWPIWWW